MATNMLEGKQIPVDVKPGVLSPEVFTLLESQETQVSEGIKTLIQENLSSTRETWLVHSLVDYYYLTQSSSVVAILCFVQEPHDKYLLEKFNDGIKSQEHQLSALQLLLHIVCKQPSWISKIVNMSVLKVIIKCLKVETSIPILMTAVTIVTILLPSIPTLVGPYLPDIFEIFNKLASFTVKKPPGNTPDIFYLHLQISVYALFHRLYGMFPYNFLAYQRQYYSKKENIHMFDEVMKGMLERVRLHPQLITGNREQETSTQRWRQMETHDVVVECNKMSLDPVEGTWEELQCPIIAAKYVRDQPSAYMERLRHAVPPLILPSTLPALALRDPSPGAVGHEVFWSPSEVIGLSTPPPTLVVSSHETLAGNISSQYISPAVVVNAGTTPMNTPRETPPISEDYDRTASRTNSRGAAFTKMTDPKRLSSDLSLSQTVPLLTPSSHVPSVPPSPLKAEFTSTPPFGVKTLPVINAARELQFDQDQSTDQSMSHVTKINQSRAGISKHVTKPDQLETKPQKKLQTTPVRFVSGTPSEESMKDGIQRTGSTFTPEKVRTMSDSARTTFTPEKVRTMSDSARTTVTPEKVRTMSDSARTTFTPEKVRTISESSATTSTPEKVRTMSDRTTVSKAETVSIDTISRVIEGLESQTSQDDYSDDEVSELTSSSRSHFGQSAILTSESVKKFMKSVNRIRFNSLTVMNSMEPEQVRFGSKRSRSCPQFPKIETMSEEDEGISRSVSVTGHDTPQSEIVFDPEIDTSIFENKFQSETVSMPQTTDSMCDISISSTNSTVTVSTKQETMITIQSTASSDISVSKYPEYSGKLSSFEDRKATNDMVQIFKQVLDMPSAAACPKCQGHVDESPAGSSKSFFSTFSPPELLDRHIRLGRDIHAKELSKLPIPTTHDVNWTHFGGRAPVDEVNILRGQLMLLHNQLMYERHKRDQHAKRNRRLLRKIAHTKTLEEQNNSMGEQLRQNEMTIRDLQVSLKLIQVENRKCQGDIDSEEYERLVQLRSCLQENEDLKNVKKEFNMLLVRQREEQDSLNKRLMMTESQLFNTEKELENMRDMAVLNTKLKDQVLQLQKERLLMGEIQQKCSDKLLNYKVSRASRLEHDHIKSTLQHELREKNQVLAKKTVQLDCCQHQLREQQEMLSSREIALSELKSNVEKVKTSHEDELKCVADQHQAALRVNQALESHILQLYMELEDVKSKHSKGGLRTTVAVDAVAMQDNRNGDGVQEFRDRTSSDPLQSPTKKKKNVTRMTSLPASSDLDVSPSSDLDPQRSTDGSQRSAGANSQFPPKQTVIEEGYELIEQQDSVYDLGRRRAGSETPSMSSRDSSMFPGQRNLLYTDSEDNRSASNRSSSNMGDSGFS